MYILKLMFVHQPSKLIHQASVNPNHLVNTRMSTLNCQLDARAIFFDGKRSDRTYVASRFLNRVDEQLHTAQQNKDVLLVHAIILAT